ncbi:VOC family protein [Arthrobacter sp. zg-Y1219]|uniref:VOC family protein n=1 Tax=Arthrobacter sp. zg-Y1219 TaxID=3049067 RepID=UPI0024C2A39D|nr:VOC family protein [Arthrobacter sp. zg-Y1219]MDK1358972.1 VOC family protein [Arthrobacter sp. zg-Y1219]
MTSAFSSLALDAVDVRRMADFWTRALDYRIAEEEDGVISLASSDGAGPPIDILPVPEGKTVKNRLHLDLRAVGCTQQEEVDRLLELGAVLADVGQDPEVSWTVLADPEGNEFCILASSSEAAS